MVIMYFFGGIFAVAGATMIYVGFGKYRDYNFVQNLPTSDIDSVPMGAAEITGSASSPEPLLAPMSKTECVYYKYTIEEYRHQDKGSDWRTVHDETQKPPFEVEDETGQITVHPGRADFQVEQKHVYKIDYSGLTALKNFFTGDDTSTVTTTEITDNTWNSWSNGDKKATEYYIEQGSDVYVLGTATPDQDGPSIRDGETPFIIGDGTEEETLSSLRLQAIILLIAGALFAVIGILVLLGIFG